MTDVKDSKETKKGKTVSFTIPALPRPSLRRVPLARMRYGLCMLVLVLVATGGGAVGAYLERRSSNTGLISTSFNGQKKVITSQSQLISQIAKTVGPSVVSVNVDITSAAPQSAYDYYTGSGASHEQAAGTGIIISESGLIITNRHVVPSGTTSVSVTLSDGTELKDVSVVGRTGAKDSLDIAFLKIDDLKGHKLTPAVIGQSANVQVGDDAVAIGNALGQFQNTVTSGIISGFGRSVQAGSSDSSASDSENLDNLFQTDAAINEGNSGGPLVNLNGQVIGINTAIAGNAQNIGFAIPIDDVRGLIDQVLKTGKFQKPYLGVRYVPLNTEIATSLGLKQQSGAYVAPAVDPASPSVLAGSPADKAGLSERDIITEVDGHKIDASHSLTSLLDQHAPGDKVSLTVVRGDETKRLEATLEAVPQN